MPRSGGANITQQKGIHNTNHRVPGTFNRYTADDRVPANKQHNIVQHISKILEAPQHPAGSLQSLAGKLFFIAKAFPLGRPFIQRLYDLAAAKHPKRLVQLDDIVQQDLQLWSTFLNHFKGWLLILDTDQRKKASMTIFTGASANPKLGWGIYVPETGIWSYGRWNP